MTNGAGSDIVADFRKGLELVKRYPALVAPPLIAMVVAFVLKVFLFGGAVTMFAVGGLAGALVGGSILFMVFFGVTMLVNLIASAVVVVMARDALAGREPSIGAGFDVVMTRLGDVVVASIVFTVIVGIASIFLVLPGILAAIFLVFTLPAVLLDNLGAIDAVKRSARLVKDNVGPVLGLAVGAIVAAVVLMIVSMVLNVVPVLGPLASVLLAGAFFAYLAVVAVRVYQTLPRR